jgi:hypothetical protein
MPRIPLTCRRESKAPETVGREATGAGVPFLGIVHSLLLAIVMMGDDNLRNGPAPVYLAVESSRCCEEIYLFTTESLK